MKTLTILALVFVQSFAMAQEAPAKVKESCKKKFPAAKEIDWTKDGANYVGEFYENDMTVLGTFDATGKWLETKTSIEETEIPSAVAKAALAKHKGTYLSNQSKIENSDDVVTYEIILSSDDAIYTLLISEEGEVLKSEKQVFLDVEDSSGDE
ncbi:MAG: PepSY-like domain-containing protein [Flavobacteriales bacterium]|nr:PepSY-like domain-containing protein [Flavobacteriales bacterium]MCB9365058.1 PepSY-like domain-containing protein [Flavobacteriales bacterium]